MRWLQVFASRKRSAVVVFLAACIALGVVATISAAVLANGGKPSKADLLHQAAAAATVRAQGPHAAKHPGAPLASCPRPWIPGIYAFRPDGPLHNAPMNNQAALRTSGGLEFLVYAGSSESGSLQGTLVVQQVFADPCKEPLNAAEPQPQNFPDPHQDGSLTITKIAGSTVYFSATDGATGSFDVASDTYR